MKRILTRASHFNRTLRHTPLLALVLAALLISVSLCTTSDPVDTGIMERTDLVFTGDLDLQAFIQNPEGEGSDLIELVDYGVPVNRLDVAMDLGSGYVLYLRVYNDIAEDLNDLTNHQYNVYPPEELEDKQSYLLAELRRDGEVASYYSNLGTNLPPGTNINALTLESTDGLTLHGRLKDVSLYKNTDPEVNIVLNGTFVSALSLIGELTIVK